MSGSFLRLTAFERYMLCDDRGQAFPMSIPMRWIVFGKPDREAFAAAFAEAVSWHPMLHSSLIGDAWQPTSRAVAEIGYFGAGSSPDAGDRVVDVRHGPSLRCNVIETELGAEIEFVTHHAVTDGVSFLEFAGDVFALYAARLTGRPWDKVRRPKSDYLPQRMTLDRALPEPVSASTIRKTVVRESLRFFTRRAEVVAADSPRVSEGLPSVHRKTPNAPKEAGDRVAWRMCDVTLDREVTERLLQATGELNVSLNEWAIAALLRTVARWNDDHHQGSPNGWLIANMPVLLRPRAAFRTSAANMIGYAFLARQRSELLDWQATIKSLAEESQFIRYWKMAGMLLDGVARAKRLPGGLYLATRSTRPATCVMTHVGDPMRRFRCRFPSDEDGYPLVGDLKLKQLSGAAPVRPGTHVAGLINTLANRLNLSLRVAPQFLSEAAAKSLVNTWREEMVEHL